MISIRSSFLSGFRDKPYFYFLALAAMGVVLWFFLFARIVISWSRQIVFADFIFTIVLLFIIGALSLKVLIQRLAWRSRPPRVLFRVPIIILTGVMFAGAFLRFQAPMRHYLFFDEDHMLHMAQMMGQNGFPSQCDYGTFKKGALDCERFIVPIQSEVKPGFYILVAAASRVSGLSVEAVAFALNMIFGVTTISVAFYAGRALFSSLTGLFAAIFVALLPTHVWLSATTASEISAIFFLLSGLFSFAHYIRNRQQYHFFILALLIVCYATAVRNELTIVLPLFALFWLVDHEVRAAAVANRTNVGLTLIVAFVVGMRTVLTIVSTRVFGDAYGHYGSMVSAKNFLEHVTTFFFTHLALYDPVVLALLIGFIVGIPLLYRRSPSVAIVFVGIPITLFLFYMSYIFGDDRRMEPLWMIPMIIIAAIGSATLYEKVVVQALPFRLSQAAPLFGLTVLLVGTTFYVGRHYPALVPFSSNLHLAREHEAELNFQRFYPQCLYVDQVVEKHFRSGFGAIRYEEFERRMKEGEHESLLREPCVILFVSVGCLEGRTTKCDSILESHHWRPISVPDVPAWQLIETAEQEEYTISIPASMNGSYGINTFFDFLWGRSFLYGEI